MIESIQDEIRRRLELPAGAKLPDAIVTGRDRLIDGELRHLFTRMAWVLLDQWQPIETAPREVYVLTFQFGTKGIRMDYFDTTDNSPWIGEPTHWMPLPEPPKESANG